MGALRAMLWEIKLELLSTKRYRFGMISDIVVFGVMMMFFLLSNSGQSFAGEYGFSYKTLLLYGYIAWMYAVSALSTATSTVSGELSRGTFYKKMNSKYPLHFLLFGNLIAGIFLQTIVASVLVLIAVLVFRVKIILSISSILLILISTIGMYGIGLIIAGITLLVKQTGSILFIVQTGLLFVTDTLPSSNSILKLSRFLPLTTCNIAVKKICSGMPYFMDVIYLLVSSFVFICLGIEVFNIFLFKAKKCGNILFY